MVTRDICTYVLYFVLCVYHRKPHNQGAAAEGSRVKQAGVKGAKLLAIKSRPVYTVKLHGGLSGL